jgi:hypothetical protein
MMTAELNIYTVMLNNKSQVGYTNIHAKVKKSLAFEK